MKKFVYLFAVVLALFAISCDNEDLPQDTLSGEPEGSLNTTKSVTTDSRTWPTATGTISGEITTNTTLTDDKVWYIDGPTYVTSGAVLTVEANTLVKGMSVPTSGSASYLIITKGCQLIADGGGASTSIVFTSDVAAGQRSAGDWGGIVLLGDATTNQPNTQEIEGIEDADIPDENHSLVQYGGSNDSHSAGSLSYVRIEYAGRDLGGGNEINGLTLGGVGSGTTLDHIQVSFGLDDAFEFFGGTVNAKYLIAFANRDDDFDFDQGYSGSIQFAVSRKLSLSEQTFTNDPNGIECDNDADNPLLNPVTRPILSNISIIGMDNEISAAENLYGNRWRRGTSFVFKNSIIAGYSDAGVFFDSAETENNLNGGGAEFSYNLVHSYATKTGDVILPAAATGYSGYANNTVNDTDPNFMDLVSPYSTSNPDFRYRSTTYVIGTDFSGELSAPFFTSTTYKGAFASRSRWDDNWASYQPNNNTY